MQLLTESVKKNDEFYEPGWTPELAENNGAFLPGKADW